MWFVTENLSLFKLIRFENFQEREVSIRYLFRTAYF